jgi:hypothetical protein
LGNTSFDKQPFSDSGLGSWWEISGRIYVKDQAALGHSSFPCFPANSG